MTTAQTMCESEYYYYDHVMNHNDGHHHDAQPHPNARFFASCAPDMSFAGTSSARTTHHSNTTTTASSGSSSGSGSGSLSSNGHDDFPMSINVNGTAMMSPSTAAAPQSGYSSAMSSIIEPTPLGPPGCLTIVPSLDLNHDLLRQQTGCDGRWMSSLLSSLADGWGTAIIHGETPFHGTPPSVPMNMDPATSSITCSNDVHPSHFHDVDAASSQNRSSDNQEYQVVASSITSNLQTALDVVQSVVPSLPSPKRDSVSSSTSDGLSTRTPTERRFRLSHIQKWQQRYQEMMQFKLQFGHCVVPLEHCENAALAHWVKRQRCQYKIKMAAAARGKPDTSTLTDERKRALDELGFVWDAHKGSWEIRVAQVKEFVRANGHCRIPSHHPANQPLAVWVKCQRRQYKLLKMGKTSNIDQRRVNELSQYGFVWEPRANRAAAGKKVRVEK